MNLHLLPKNNTTSIKAYLLHKMAYIYSTITLFFFINLGPFVQRTARQKLSSLSILFIPLLCTPPFFLCSPLDALQWGMNSVVHLPSAACFPFELGIVLGLCFFFFFFFSLCLCGVQLCQSDERLQRFSRPPASLTSCGILGDYTEIYIHSTKLFPL